MNLQRAENPPRHNQPVIVFTRSGVAKVGMAVHDRVGRCIWYIQGANVNISFLQGEPTRYASIPLHTETTDPVEYWCEFDQMLTPEVVA